MKHNKTITIITDHYSCINGVCSPAFFIRERVTELEKMGYTINIFYFFITSTFFLRLFYYLAKRKKLQQIPKSVPDSMSGKSDIITIPYGILDFIFPGRFISNKIRRQIVNMGGLLESNIINIHTSDAFFSPLYYIKKHFHIPMILTLHGYPNRGAIIAKKIGIVGYRRLFRNLDKIICVSSAQYSWLIEHKYSNKNITIVNNGIDLNDFYPIPGLKRPNEICVGYVGRLSIEKGVERIPKIIKELQKIIKKEVNVILVGGGVLNNKLNELFVEEGISAVFVGEVPSSHVVDWMNKFNVLIVPSYSEAWGCVIREAYACGVPVVGSNVGGIPENLAGAGIVIPFGEDFEKRFAEGIAEMLTSPPSCSDLIKIARSHTWFDCVTMESKIYQSITEDN